MKIIILVLMINVRKNFGEDYIGLKRMFMALIADIAFHYTLRV